MIFLFKILFILFLLVTIIFLAKKHNETISKTTMKLSEKDNYFGLAVIYLANLGFLGIVLHLISWLQLLTINPNSWISVYLIAFGVPLSVYLRWKK